MWAFIYDCGCLYLTGGVFEYGYECSGNLFYIVVVISFSGNLFCNDYCQFVLANEFWQFVCNGYCKSFWQMCSGNSFYMVTVISFWANVILATWPAFALHFKTAKMVNVALDCIDL
jgi:hypothetical protein